MNQKNKKRSIRDKIGGTLCLVGGMAFIGVFLMSAVLLIGLFLINLLGIIDLSTVHAYAGKFGDKAVYVMLAICMVSWLLLIFGGSIQKDKDTEEVK